ncbi:DUF1127 domain-containing protein [Alsobacter sp. SYSU M60028]|uniref:DUF1127 domain-containing protein n=1 Tax=Alsobacter ponti TaxID=2962936 RepID=A0ABT1LGL3_9HYPH|nr:DUF1127 domain-containing protein [Alsobacter ponti]MCP8940569.1 DUF1127 domain-containing protein [Alsobacter ponti]
MPSLVLSPRRASVSQPVIPWSRIGAAALRVALWPVRFYAARRQFAALAALNDHELHDIGLSRTDLISATALPRDVDPTQELARLVAARRHVGR